MSQGFIDESVRDESDPDTTELTRQFVQITGARPLALLGVSSHVKIKDAGDTVLACWPAPVVGLADHPRAWLVDGEVMITIEPYLGNRECEFVAEAFEAAGWRCVPLPRCYGMWAPPRSRLFLVAKPDSKVDLDAVRSKLLRAKQPYWRESRLVDHSLAEMVAAELAAE